MAKKKKIKRKNKKKIEKVSLTIKLKEFIKSKVSKKNISKFFKPLKTFIGKHSDKLSNIKSFLVIIFGYGVLINIPAFTFFNSKFNLLTIISFGVFYYFIKDEFIEWIRRLFFRK